VQSTESEVKQDTCVSFCVVPLHKGSWFSKVAHFETLLGHLHAENASASITTQKCK
jgi:hypothetical protein